MPAPDKTIVSPETINEFTTAPMVFESYESIRHSNSPIDNDRPSVNQSRTSYDAYATPSSGSWENFSGMTVSIRDDQHSVFIDMTDRDQITDGRQTEGLAGNHVSNKFINMQGVVDMRIAIRRVGNETTVTHDTSF